MKRFATYLYEYDRTIRGRNVGFIRNDIRSDCYRMEIHIRGLERIKEKAPIYIIVRDGDCIGIPAGEIVISQGIGNACLELHGDRIGKTDYSVNNIQAVIVRYDGGKMLMGCYVQHPAGDLLSGTFTKWEAQAVPEPPQPNSDATRGVNNDSDSSRPDSQPTRGVNDNSVPPRPDPQPARGIVDDSDSSRPAEDASQSVEVHAEEICPDEEDNLQPPTYKRIAITDIRTLPSRNWHLCNNSFLVHGFFCYHYLVLKTVNAPDGAKMYLGVPGIFAQQERMMALLFGFNDFEVSQDDTPDPQPSSGSFGYWLCPLET